MSSDGISERQVTTELEHGNASHVQDLFRGKFEEERFASLKAMSRLYQADIKAGLTKTDLEFDARIFNNPSITIRKDGRQVYQDTLDLTKLEHSDGSSIPENRKPFNMAEIRKVTTDLEHGDPHSFKIAQDGKFMEERVRFMKAIGKLNDTDKADQTTDVGLGFRFSGSKWAGNEMNVNYYHPGGFFSSDFWMSPRQLYSEVYDVNTGQRKFSLHPYSEK
jgi:hypothetical protein